MRTLWALALAAVLVSYSNHFANGFHFDDFHSVVNNPAIRNLDIPRFFEDASTISVLSANRVWRPVLVTSFAVDYRLAGGLNPTVFQVSTFIWFVVQLVLMLVLFRKVLLITEAGGWAEYSALFAVAWYGLHPAMAETVNYICQRGDVFVGLGVVAGLVLYAMKPGLRKYGLYLVPVILATLAKPPAVVFAPLLLAYVYLFEAEGGWRRALTASIPGFVTAGLLLTLHSAMTPKSFTPSVTAAFNYLITQPYVAWRAFRTFFMPLWLSADTDLRPLSSLGEPAALAGFAFLAMLIGAIWVTGRRAAWRPVCFGLVWFLLGLLPTAVFPLSEVENDHRLFLPFIGLALAATWTVALLLKSFLLPQRQLKTWLPAAAVLVLSLYGHGTWMRNEVWRSDETLWRDVTEKSPENGRGWMNYGVVLMAKGRMQEAVSSFERALPYTPNYSLLHVNLGIAYGVLGRAKEAEEHFIRAQMLQPSDPASYLFYGRWLMQAGRNAQAIQVLRTTLTKDGDHADAETMLNSLLAQESTRGGTAAAPAATVDPVAAAKAVAEKNPTPENYLNLSLALHQARRFPESIAAARQALRLRPEYAEAYNNIAAGYEELKDWDRAIEAAEQALRINPAFELARNNLAYSKSQKAVGRK